MNKEPVTRNLVYIVPYRTRYDFFQIDNSHTRKTIFFRENLEFPYAIFSDIISQNTKK